MEVSIIKNPVHWWANQLTVFGMIETSVMKELNKDLFAGYMLSGQLKIYPFTHFRSIHFYNPWKYQKTTGFSMFQGGVYRSNICMKWVKNSFPYNTRITLTFWSFWTFWSSLMSLLSSRKKGFYVAQVTVFCNATSFSGIG